MAKSKQNPSRPAQTVTIFVFGNSTVNKKEPPPSWEDLQAFAESIEQPLADNDWPHRRVPKKRLYRHWRMYAFRAAALRLCILQAGMEISPELSKAFYEVRACEERARRAMLDKVPPRKRGC